MGRKLQRSNGPCRPEPANAVWRRSSLRGGIAGAAFALSLCLLFAGCPQPNPTPDGPSTSEDESSSGGPRTMNTDGATPAAETSTETHKGASSTDPPSPKVGPSPTTDGASGAQGDSSANAKGPKSTADPPQSDANAGVPSSQPNPLRPHAGPPSVPTVAQAAKGAAAQGSDANLFEGWQKPQAVVAITGEQHGYIEPCGCTGLANQRGGLARRYSFLQSLRDRGWNVAALDTGNQIRRFGVQAEIKFQSTIAGLKQMGYQAVALGPDDLRLSAPMLAGLVVPTDDQPSLFFSGSARLFGDDSFLPQFRVLESGGLKIGVTSVIGPSRSVTLNGDDVTVAAPQQAAAAAAAKLRRANCDWTILIVQGSLEETRQIARGADAYDIVVCSGEPGEPTRLPQAIEGTRAKLILVGYKGMHVGVLGFFGGAGTEFRYQRVPLDARFPDAKPMLELLADYQNTLKLKGLEGLGVKPLPHPSGRKFVGSDSCADCHEEAYTVWKEGVDGKGGPHWHATESLIHPGERSEIPRHYDPECLSCHVTGWNPQQYYPYESGYLDLQQSKHLLGNGCENCHGPASAHVAAENGDLDADDSQLEKLRQELHLSLDNAEQRCMECHDLDNSPDFHVRGAFEEYWEKIRH